MRAVAIIVSYRTGPVLRDCLEALAAQDVAEIVIVDNGDCVGDADQIDSFASANLRARVVRGQGNVGFAVGCNLGVAAASRGDDLLVFINPDVILAPGAVERLREAFHTAPAPTLVGGALFSPSGEPERGFWRDRVTLWRALVSFTGLSRLAGEGPALRDIHRHQQPLPDHSIEVGVVSGAFMALRRADFEALRGFDEGYFLHVEDIDLCRRVEAAGGRVVLQPAARGVHHRSSSDAPSEFVERCKARGFGRYFRKFARSWLERIVAEGVGAMLLIVLPARARWRGR